MFDLEKEIQNWRKRMLAGGISSMEALDELEAHLRDDIAEQTTVGATAKDAFENAVARIGEPKPLRKEFSKVGQNWLLRRQKLKYALLRFFGVPAPTPFMDVLSPSVREALELGGKEATAFHHHYIGTEHVLLGLLGAETGTVCNALRGLGVDPATVRSEIEKFVGVGPEHPAAPFLPMTPRAKHALVRAGVEASAQKQSNVGPEHVLLGLLEAGGVAEIVLRQLGVDIERARRQVLRH